MSLNAPFKSVRAVFGPSSKEFRVELRNLAFYYILHDVLKRRFFIIRAFETYGNHSEGLSYIWMSLFDTLDDQKPII